ncbi:hypothetical protein [Devriesea agamarum]|uniref:hypothetical protein n=1 Tax=Devriesea agamarum TaxID=472569 RepID=UPI00071E42ED|nr:hypothetical protein [Devriesea agamarum]
MNLSDSLERRHALEGQAGDFDLWRMRRGVKNNAIFLIIFTLIYLAPLIIADCWVARISGMCAAVMVFLIGVLIVRKRPGVTRRLSKTQGLAVGMTSIAEFFAVVVGLLAGFTMDKWWWFGVLTLGAVTVHFVALTVAFRRPIDGALLPVMVIASAIVILAEPHDLWNYWSVAGSLAAGCTATYAFAMVTFLRRMPTLAVAKRSEL